MNNTSRYDNIKTMYADYIKQIEKSASSDSLARYQGEHSLLKRMYNAAIAENKTDELKSIEENYAVLKEKMKKFGIILKSIDE